MEHKKECLFFIFRSPFAVGTESLIMPFEYNGLPFILCVIFVRSIGEIIRTWYAETVHSRGLVIISKIRFKIPIARGTVQLFTS